MVNKRTGNNNRRTSPKGVPIVKNKPDSKPLSEPFRKERTTNLDEKDEEYFIMPASPLPAIEVTADTNNSLPSILENRFELINSYLNMKEQKANFAAYVNKYWNESGGELKRFLVNFSDRETEILCRVQLTHLASQISQAVSTYNTELARYLVEIEGYSSSSVFK